MDAAAGPIALQEVTIVQIRELLAAGHISARQLVRLYLQRIQTYDRRGPSLGSILAINKKAESQADTLDAYYQHRGKPSGALHGIPVVVKDNYGTADMPTTAGSAAMEGWKPTADSYVVAQLRKAGALILAKANMGEFAIGDASSLGGQVRNPYMLDRTPSGSSAGTAVAVAANLAVAGVGTDTGGSIRQPAAFSALVGLRPTVGLIDQSGIIPVSRTQDTAGPLTRTVMDAAILLDVLCGEAAHENDSTQEGSVRRAGRPYAQLNLRTVEDCRIGVVPALQQPAAGEDAALIDQLTRRSISVFRQLGAVIVPMPCPGLLDHCRDIDATVKRLEFRRDLDAYLEKAGNGTLTVTLADLVASGKIGAFPRVQERVGEGLKIDSDNLAGNPDYLRVLKSRARVRRELLTAMDAHGVTAILYPTFTAIAVRIGHMQRGSNAAISSAVGFPAITVPGGLTESGCPVGIELLARPFDEAALVDLAAAFEGATGYRQPPACTPALAGENI